MPLLSPLLSIGRAAPRGRSIAGRSEWVVRGGVEPPTFRFSGGRSYQLSYLTKTATGVPDLARRESGRRAGRS
jgi:hypothetical protein